ncbi:MAG: DUF1853 family protein [Kingella sp. (in: b-proteobacteria)]
MNYAIDAIWWRLKNSRIRALASLLTAPPLWQTHCELPVRELLGEQGFRLLLSWDDSLFQLPEPVSSRLGYDAENLLAFWFQHAPHAQLLARNIQTKEGEWDFLVKLNGCVYHIELCCKYYGSETGLPETMRGLNEKDILINKYNKLKQQMMLPNKDLLRHLGLNEQNIKNVSIVRGMGFTHSGSLPKNDVYSPNAWQGVLLQSPEQLDQTARFYALDRLDYLAPVRVCDEQTISSQAIRTKGLYAQVALRPDGYWHETQRFMFFDI